MGDGGVWPPGQTSRKTFQNSLWGPGFPLHGHQVAEALQVSCLLWLGARWWHSELPDISLVVKPPGKQLASKRAREGLWEGFMLDRNLKFLRLCATRTLHGAPCSARAQQWAQLTRAGAHSFSD